MALKVINSSSDKDLEKQVNDAIAQGFVPIGGITFGSGGTYYQEVTSAATPITTPYTIISSSDMNDFSRQATDLHTANPKILALGELHNGPLGYMQAFGEERPEGSDGADGSIYTVDNGNAHIIASEVITDGRYVISAFGAKQGYLSAENGAIALQLTNGSYPAVILMNDGEVHLEAVYPPVVNNAIVTKRYVDANKGADATVYMVDANGHALIAADRVITPAPMMGIVDSSGNPVIALSDMGTWTTIGDGVTSWISFDQSGLIQLVGSDFQCGGNYTPTNDKSIATKKYVDEHGGYTLPVATTTILGGVKASASVQVASDGTMSVVAGADKNVWQVDSAGYGHIVPPSGKRLTRIDKELEFWNDAATPVALGSVKASGTELSLVVGSTSVVVDDNAEHIMLNGSAVSLESTYVPITDNAVANKKYVDDAVSGAASISLMYVDPDTNFNYAGGTYIFTAGNNDLHLGLKAGVDGERAVIGNWGTTELQITMDTGVFFYSNGQKSAAGASTSISANGGSCTLAFKTDTWYQVA